MRRSEPQDRPHASVCARPCFAGCSGAGCGGARRHVTSPLKFIFTNFTRRVIGFPLRFSIAICWLIQGFAKCITARQADSHRRGSTIPRTHLENLRAVNDIAERQPDRRRSSTPARRGRQARRRARRGVSGSRCAITSSSSSIGAKPVISLISPACASTRRISSAFCSPVEASRAGMPLPAWVTARSDRCGPSSVRPAAASRARFSFSSAR